VGACATRRDEFPVRRHANRELDEVAEREARAVFGNHALHTRRPTLVVPPIDFAPPVTVTPPVAPVAEPPPALTEPPTLAAPAPPTVGESSLPLQPTRIWAVMPKPITIVPAKFPVAARSTANYCARSFFWLGRDGTRQTAGHGVHALKVGALAVPTPNWPWSPDDRNRQVGQPAVRA